MCTVFSLWKNLKKNHGNRKKNWTDKLLWNNEESKKTLSSCLEIFLNK